uniref:HORMA domain-containing protein n=1 Tax=Biomphalaria glabrata TaxID=6526 RepID=A0A2C9KAD6_BIOGL
MMATSQLHRNQGKTWESIFPNEQVTEQKSALFVKKLLAVAISNITYLRAIFPEHAYGDKSLEDLNLKILRDESSCPGACQVIKWVKGCFDALDKKYLKTLIIGIYIDPNDPESVIESYTFKFSYNNHGEIDIYRNDKKVSSAYSSEETKKATIRLLRTLVILTNTLTSLPDNVMMTMKLFYYDEVTPADYEPPGFRPANDSAFHFAEEATNIAIGEVVTPFHMVKLRIKTGSKQFEFEDEPVEVMEHSDQVMSISNAGLDNESNMLQEITSEKAKSVSALNIELKGDKKLSPTQPDSKKSPGKPKPDEENFLVRCPCGCNEDDGLMVMCSCCKFWQHGICFLIKSEDKAPTDHICDVCAKPGNAKLEPTDSYLSSLCTVERQGTCLWRRTLSACLEYKRIIAPQLSRRLGIDNNVAQGLINRLEKEKFLIASSTSKRLGKTIDHERITNDGIPRYLSTPNSVKSNTLQLPEAKDNAMDIGPVNTVSSGKPTAADKDITTLSLKTSNLNLQNSKRVTRSSSSETEKNTFPLPESTVKRGRKRAYSKINSNEFDICESQENQCPVSKKKASTVTKDIAV